MIKSLPKISGREQYERDEEKETDMAYDRIDFEPSAYCMWRGRKQRRSGESASAEMTAEPESEEGKQIVRYLRENGETYADDIADALDMDLSALLSELTVLELDGYVQTLFGKRYRAAEAMSV